jgi:hypothetical protein
MAYNPNLSIANLAGQADNSGSSGLTPIAGSGPGFNLRRADTLVATAGSTLVYNVNGANSIMVGIGNTTTNTIIFEGTVDGTNWYNIEVFDETADLWVSGQSITPTIGKSYHLLAGGLISVRLRVNGSALSANLNVFFVASMAEEILAAIDTGDDRWHNSRHCHNIRCGYRYRLLSWNNPCDIQR